MRVLRSSKLWLGLLASFCLSQTVAGTCNPCPEGAPCPQPGVGIVDYYTVRSDPAGRVISRDISPEPRPREAITGDDYYQLKLEHIYVADTIGRDVGNLAIIAEIGGILPDSLRCRELDVSELEFQLNQRERGTHPASGGCAYKYVVSVNPVFNQSHVTFDSAFITPPVRMGLQHISIRFIIAQLNDVSLARQIVDWSEQAVNNLGDLGLGELNRWQSELVNIGFTAANYVLDYASRPTYFFEFETDFVPIETVGGVTTPQNIFMGGDFVIVGFPRADERAPAGARVAAEQLVFDSGRLYWRDSNIEFREGPYIVFKVVRQSRFPAQLPVTLARMARFIERGRAADEMNGLMRNAVLDLQDDRVVNQTEGQYLLDVFEWYAQAAEIHAALEEAALNGDRPEPNDWPMQMREAPMSIGPDLALAELLSQANTIVDRLENRVYENYQRNPGLWQAECVVLRTITQGLADTYAEVEPSARTAFEDLQIARSRLQRASRRSAAEEEEYQQLSEIEIWADRVFSELPEELPEPACPALRR